ncbi:MAG: cyclophilin-like fold protein [Treponema sp.]
MSATLEDNSSSRALVEKLKTASVTYEAHDYGGFEKVGDLPLYFGKRFVIYYDTNSWNFTKLGMVNDLTQQELKDFLSAVKGNVKITLSLD